MDVYGGTCCMCGLDGCLPTCGENFMLIAALHVYLHSLYTGWLCDVTGDFSVSFLISGSFLLLGAFIIFTLSGICCRTRTGQSEMGTCKDGGRMADRPVTRGCCECRMEQPWLDSPVLKSNTTEVPFCHHWPPLEQQTGCNKLEGDQSSQENCTSEDGCLEEAKADTLPLSAATLLQYPRSSPVTELQLSSSAVL